jgi:hypothetical protein
LFDFLFLNNFHLENELFLKAVVGSLEKLVVHVREFQTHFLHFVNCEDEHLTVFKSLKSETPDHVLPAQSLRLGKVVSYHLL